MAAGIKLSKISSFELNPRGNIWFNDDTTLGHKLLSKMGWSKGKGLGKNEDGITENIKISKKDNLSGVGFKNDAYISVGCIEYENILKKLQEHFKSKESSEKATVESLEQRSRSSKSRLHYQKFITGKDLFRRSEKDMKCIFLENPQDSSKSHSIRSTDEEITTVKSELSVSDYFAQKMQQKLSICSKAEDLAKIKTPEMPCSIFTKKRKNDEGSEKRKKIKLEFKEHSNKWSSPSEREEPNLNKIKRIPSNETKNKKSEFRKVARKKKFPKIKNLKSCIKLHPSDSLGKNRKVCFNDHVLYKVLDNRVENITEINVPLNSNSNDEFDMVDYLQLGINKNNNKEKQNEMSKESNEINSKPINEEVSLLFANKKKMNKVVEKDSEKQALAATSDQKENEVNEPECFNLPVCSASSYNCWLESQRTALKMKLYRNMIKKLKRHHILSTTNLLDIKGYGNWGFKL